MSSPRRYKEPPPRVRVLDFSSTDEDRFALPKASIQFSPDGKCQLEVPERPAVRVLRYEADEAAAAASAAAQRRAAAPPSGRRHHAYLAFLEALRRKEARWGAVNQQDNAKVAASSATRVPHTARGSGVAACLVWQAGADVGNEAGQECGAAARPSTAAAAGKRCTSPASLDMWSQAPHTASTPRFKSRAVFEQRRCATPDADAIKRYGYLAAHRARRSDQAAREAREAQLAAAWPHGLPRSLLRNAAAAGLRVGGVGIGGNPLSLPQREYAALRPGMKR